MPVKRSTQSGPSSQKRTRFASPPPSTSQPGSSSTNALIDIDEAYLEEDLPQSSTTQKNREKRQLKDTSGYNSDSSNENEEGVVPDRNKKVDDDGDVDMFGDELETEDKDEGKGKGKGKGKEKEFMDLNDVEGQEFERTKRDGTENSDSDSEEEVEKKATTRLEGLDSGFGIDITPFNMKSEMEEGRFTADGEGYQANDKDPNEKHDMWLDDVDKDEIKKARRAHREREKVEREREEKEVEEGGRKEREEELLREAVGLLERGETVLEGLQRLGKVQEDKRKEEEGKGKKKSWAERQKERKAAMAADEAERYVDFLLDPKNLI
jgi:CD2 antigen cytoplasmic tail-binding protein 2